MATTVIYAHPYEGSFNHAILQETQKLLAAKNEACRVIDLYAEGFNPVYSKEELALFSQGQALDPLVQKYQQMIKESRRLIFIFPIWWADMPAIVKGFLDKVLLKQFAYVESKTGLKGLLDIDEVLVVSTSTAPTFYLKYFCGNTVGKAMLGHTFKGVGAKRCKWVNCGRVNLAAQEKRQAFLIAAYRLAARDERVQSVITVGASWHSRQLGPVREMFENLTPAFFRENMARQVAVYEALNPQPDLDTLTADLRRMWLDISASGYPNERIAAVKAPVLAVRGERDGLFSLSDLADLHSCLPEAHLMNIPFARHEAIKEQPEILWAAVKAFYVL